jgi:hypothetical protein
VVLRDDGGLEASPLRATYLSGKQRPAVPLFSATTDNLPRGRAEGTAHRVPAAQMHPSFARPCGEFAARCSDRRRIRDLNDALAGRRDRRARRASTRGDALECSTLSLEWVRELSTRFDDRNRAFLDAPVVGSRPQAEQRKLIYVAGAPGTHSPALSPFCRARARPCIMQGRAEQAR